MAEKIACIYGLADLGGRIRYVGQTSDLRRRYAAHLRECDRFPMTKSKVWLLSLLDAGSGPEVYILEQDCDMDAAERKWIAYFRKNDAGLLNMTAGGRDAGIHHRVSHGGVQQGRSPTHRIRISLSRQAAELTRRGDTSGAAILGEKLAVIRMSLRRAYQRGGQAEINRINDEVARRIPGLSGKPIAPRHQSVNG